MNTVNASGMADVALDAQGLGRLRTQAARDPAGAVREAARQFEALLLGVMLKSMREAGGKDGMFDSDETRMYTSLLDQQLAQTLSGKGLGLADALAGQLSRSVGPAAPAAPAGDAPGAAQGTPAPAAATEGLGTDRRGPVSGPLSGPAHFIERVRPHAQEAARQTGVPERLILAQAALESGWGRREVRGIDGRESFNLFGIKAGRGWAGATVEAVTTEYVNGAPQKSVETFRAYDSYAESFRDYANFLKANPRYAQLIHSGGSVEELAQGLQRAGYATDPAYARKLVRVAEGIPAT